MIIKYPSPYDIEQAIVFRNTPFESLKQFMQGKGLISIVQGKKDIADFVSNLYLDHNDFLQLRRIAQGEEISTSISGFNLRHKYYKIDVENLLRDINLLRTEIANRRETLMRRGAPVPKLSLPTRVSENLVKITFEYERIVPGRVELMQHEESSVSFNIEQVTPVQWRIVCFPQANQDVKAVEELFKNLGKGSYEVFTISLAPFSRQNRVLFFDTLIKYYSEDKDWRVIQVTEITIRKLEALIAQAEVENGGVELSSDEELVDIQQVGRQDLNSITQAILEGKNLRTNSFVKDCEKQGYFFLSMTLELKNINLSEIIQVRLRFKLSPEMFEVVLVNMALEDENGRREISFPEQRQQEILKEFWNNCHKVWQEIYDNSPRLNGKQMTTADAIEAQSAQAKSKQF